jgi:membrane protease YdiL (CAAX protease family)
MKKICAGFVAVAGTVLLTGVSHVLANEPKGEGAPDYSGVTGIYYTLIGLILAYGVYDSFLKKS